MKRAGFPWCWESFGNPVGRLENWSLNHSECGMLMATVTLAGDVGSWELTLGVCLYKESLRSALRATKKSQGQSPGIVTKIPATTGINYFLQPQLVNPGFLVAINSTTSLFNLFCGDA